MSDAKYHDPLAAGVYKAIALRFYSRYVEARQSAEFRGGDLPDHGRRPTQPEADERYNAAVEDCIVEAPDSADAALARGTHHRARRGYRRRCSAGPGRRRAAAEPAASSR